MASVPGCFMQGLLQRCEPCLGFITYNQATYGFATPGNMAQFAANPTAAGWYWCGVMKQEHVNSGLHLLSEISITWRCQQRVHNC